METNNKKELMETYIEEGKKLILPEKYENWTNYVNSTNGNLDSLHEVAIAISIIGMLNVGADMPTIIEIFNQKECPFRKSVVRSIVANYAIRGPEFFEKTAEGPIPEGNAKYLEKIKMENTRLLFIHAMRDSGYSVSIIPNGPIVVTTSDFENEDDMKLNRTKDE